jgi:UDP-glucuronate 4-epimerase
MKVLVTGAAGFIGSTVVDALLRRGDQVVGLDNFDPYYDPARKRRNLAAALADPRFALIEGDILDGARLRALMASQRPEGVVHLAAQVSNRRSLEAAVGDLYTLVNAGGTATLLAACRRPQPRSFVFVSTANVYDSSAPAPFREGATPDRPRTPYSRSKKEAEALVLDEAARSGLPATVLRLFTTYGPRQRPDMVHYRFTASLLRGQPLTLIGAGSDLRDYVHVDDACAAIAACLDRAPAGEIINIGSGTATTLDFLLARLARLTGREPLIRRRDAAADDTRLLLADIGKAGRLLGWKPGTGLEAGLENFVSWLTAAENQIN